MDKKSTYLIIGNIRSKWDRIDHLRYISKKLNSNFEIGLNIYDNYIVWLYEANGYLGSPHSSFEDKNYFYAIDFLANKLAHHESLSEFKELYLLFNEFWFDKYESEKRLLVKSNLKENRLLFTVQNLEIDAKEDRFFNYKVPSKLDRNIKYHITIEADHEKSNSPTFTVGVFNWRKKEFIVRSDILLNKEQIKFEFLIDHDDDRNQLLIFPGLHGQCVNKKLFIKKLNIFI